MAVSTIRSAMSLPNTENTQTTAQTTFSDATTTDSRSGLTGWIERFAIQDCEYEDLPTNNTTIHLCAGASAGVAEHCLMYPVDVIKTRRMMLSAPAGARYTGMLNAAKVIYQTEGVRSLWRGMGVVGLMAGPAHAVYFATYEQGKKWGGRLFGRDDFKGHLIAGAAASLVHDSIMTPVDAIKQRMQKFKSPFLKFKSPVLKCMEHMWKVEGGLSAFYRSYLTQIFMNVPQQCVHFVAYEQLKKWANPQETYNIRVHLFSGLIAGGAAAWITTPFDVVKTFLNTQETDVCKKNVTGFTNGVRTVYRSGGVSALFRGAVPRTCFIAPATAICWGVYESFKFNLPRTSFYNTM